MTTQIKARKIETLAPGATTIMLAAATGLVAATEADGNINYSGILNEVIFDETFDIDLGGTSAPEFQFRHTVSSAPGYGYDQTFFAAIYAYNVSNAVAVTSLSSDVSPLKFGANIPGTGGTAAPLLSFTDGERGLAGRVHKTMGPGASDSFNFGPWQGTGEAFIGARADTNSSFFYGWFRVSVDTNDLSITLHDYAFETEFNTSINAGEGAIPEPGTMAGMIMGAAAILAYRRKRKANKESK